MADNKIEQTPEAESGSRSIASGLLACAELPIAVDGQDATASRTGGTNAFVTYEINVSQRGKHVFATDSTVRRYSASHVARLVAVFRSVFPECDISVTAFGKFTPELPEEIRAAIPAR